ncbi:hypothetical protein [Bradyrhizobium sp. STM 3562]|uniref:hypothetical protein n=1 Tax=Bradyrhizobium sp. STM 3562 TaxID=578924 RepID=UPI00388FD47F
MPHAAQRKKAPHKPKAESRRFIGLQCGGLGRHLHATRCYSGFIAVTEPALDKIIAQLQLCIVDARALQLKMLERLLSIALLEAYETREKSANGRDDGPI